jgi:peptidoglycan/LPS O-acetylase OafA/YrhL
VALIAILLLAAAVTRWVEQPAMHWIRTRYRQRTDAVLFRHQIGR